MNNNCLILNVLTLLRNIASDTYYFVHRQPTYKTHAYLVFLPIFIRDVLWPDNLRFTIGSILHKLAFFAKVVYLAVLHCISDIMAFVLSYSEL